MKSDVKSNKGEKQDYIGPWDEVREMQFNQQEQEDLNNSFPLLSEDHSDIPALCDEDLRLSPELQALDMEIEDSLKDIDASPFHYATNFR